YTIYAFLLTPEAHLLEFPVLVTISLSAQAYTMELEAEVQKLKDLNEELVRKQVAFLQTLLLDMLNVQLQYILCKGGFIAMDSEVDSFSL
uniref:Uncharacterized protein n=1 Tax=Aegilops tauschii subsp. strangulata TaxID=200361 RepID=A0A453KZ81_AEGTS